MPGKETITQNDNRINWTIIFKFKTPFHIGSGFGFAGLVDKTTIRDGIGLTYIPASTIKGNMRDICRKIILSMPDVYGPLCETGGHPDICLDHEKSCLICSLFGSAHQSGRLYFDHARLMGEDRKLVNLLNPPESKGLKYYESDIRTNIALSRSRQIACDGHLFVSEIVNPALQYQTSLQGWINQIEGNLLETAFFLMEHLGGQKSRGLGKLKVELIKQEKTGASQDYD